MDKLIRRSWWKVMAVLILLYVFVVGMLVPLKPNVTTVVAENAVAGQTMTLTVTGYNTDFTATDSLRAWLMYDRRLSVRANEVASIDPQVARLSFALPAGLPDGKEVISPALYIDSPHDGFFARPAAASIRAAPALDSTGIAGGPTWTETLPSNLHERAGMSFPFRNILAETIRNTYFHVSLWLAMMLIFIAAVVYAIQYLRLQARLGRGELLAEDPRIVSPRERADYWSQALTGAGLAFGLLGLITGALWARYTWGSWWSWDIKQFTTLIALMIYAGYFVLRASFPDPEARGRIAAVYNIFAFAALIPLIYVLPRLSDSSLHPGNGGNPALGGDDLDNTMRMVFYPAVIGWTLVGGWLASLFYRLRRLEKLDF